MRPEKRRRLEALEKANEPPYTPVTVVLLTPGEERAGSYEKGTILVRFVSPKGREATSFALPHNGRDPVH